MGTRNAPRAKSKARRQELLRRKRQSAAARGEKLVAEESAHDENAHCQVSNEPVLQEAPSPSCAASKAATPCGPGCEETSAIKQVAAAALILGQNVTKTAQALGVDRRTLQRWGKFDPDFHEAMKETKLEVVITSRQSLLALAEAAVEKVESKLSVDQSPRVALALLRGMGALGSQPLVPQVLDDENKDEKRAQIATLVTAVPATTNHENEKRAQSATLDKSAASKSATKETDSLAGSATGAVPIEEPIYEWSDLPPEQKVAISGLFAGQPLAEVAKLASTTEETIRNWLCRDDRFFTLLSSLQFDRLLRLKHRLLNLLDNAIGIVRHAIENNNSSIALALLRGLGVL
jgi:hypothetical protein